MKFSIAELMRTEVKMKKRFISSPSKNGFTFIDVLVGISLMLIVFLGIFGVYRLGLKVVSQSKARITATSLANQNLEMIRNLPYKKVGTTPHAIDEPAGDIPQLASNTQNNIDYTVETEIIYINDCFDGPQSSQCPTAPATDDCVRDYKRTTVKVSWERPGRGEVVFKTDITPKNLNQEQEECTGQAAGVLSVSVFDALGALVPFPLIEVMSSSTGSTLASYLPPSGQHDFVFAPDTYKIKVSKSGYNTAQTFQTGDSYGGKTITTPAKSHPVVYGGKLTEIGLSIDRLGSFDIQTRGTQSQEYPLMPYVTFTLHGSKTVGKDNQENPIYKYYQDQTTNASATVSIPNLEWDSYNFSVSSLDYHLIGVESSPETTTTQPIDLLPDSNKELRLILKAENTLLVRIRDASSTLPIFGAEVKLSNDILGYNEIQPTDENGETFFIPLKENNYNLEVEAPSYASSTTFVAVSGDTLKTINLFFLPQ